MAINLNPLRSAPHIVYNRKLLSQFAPESRQKILFLYQDSLNLKELPDSKKNLQTYLDSRRNALAPLGLVSDLTPDVNQLEGKLTTLNQCLTEIGGRYHPESVRNYMKTEHENMKTVLKAQLDQDIATVNASPLAPSDKINAVNHLNTAYEKNIKTLTEDLNKDMEKIDKAIQAEQSRLFVMALMYGNNRKMKKALDEAITRTATEMDSDSLSEVTFSTNNLRNVTMDDLVKVLNEQYGGNLIAPSGSAIKAEKTADGYQFKLLTKQSGIASDNKIKADYLFMAHLLRSSGKESITCTITAKDPARAMRMARAAYNAAVEAGFEKTKHNSKTDRDDANITIIINGKPIPIEQLFTDRIKNKDGQEHEADARHQRMASQRSEQQNKSMPIADIKKTLDNYRSKLAATLPTPESTSTSPPSVTTSRAAASSKLS